MPPPAIMNGVAVGKTLHQRNKSTPAFSTLLQAGAVKAANKKVLGEVNANIKIIKDDSDIGKASPGKISLYEPVKPAAAFARPATRPLAAKSLSAQNMPTANTTTTQSTTAVTTTIPEPVRKVVAKKSTKVLKEVPLAPRPESDLLNQGSTAPVHQSLAAPRQAVQAVDKPLPPIVGVAIPHQEVRKTESIPLREEPFARPIMKPVPVNVDHNVPAGFVSEQEYMTLLAAQSTTSQIHPQPAAYGIRPVNGHAQYALPDQPPPEQFYDIDEEEYYCDDGYTTARSFGLRGESTGGVTTILAPKHTDMVQKELEAAKSFVDATRTPEDVEDEQWDTSMVAEYGDEIFGYMRELENRMSPNPRYMDQQQEIQWSMRAVLMDWVIQVHQRFNLLPETLFLTVNYIDRFLSCKIVSLGKLQLVGATAIFVAAKYEEVQCPTISEIIYMVDGGYSADELLKAERFMLSMLQFELGWPGPMSFLRRISKADDYDLETRTLAKYFLEVTVMDERFVGCTPSFLAAGAHCMARLMLRKGDWSQAHVFYSNYTYTQLRQLLAAVLECCEEPQKHHAAVFDKYLDKRYKRASTFVAGEMSKGFTLPGVTRQSSLPPGPFDSTGGRLW
ncbi:hypothetical protein LTR65_007923 [Meristemomyces frigidus]